MPCHNFFEGLIIGAAVVVIGLTSAALLDKIRQHDDKIRQHDDEIEELISRLEENDESSQENELKNNLTIYHV